MAAEEQLLIPKGGGAVLSLKLTLPRLRGREGGGEGFQAY